MSKTIKWVAIFLAAAAKAIWSVLADRAKRKADADLSMALRIKDETGDTSRLEKISHDEFGGDPDGVRPRPK